MSTPSPGKKTRQSAKGAEGVFVLIGVWRALRKHWLLGIGSATLVFLGFAFHTLGQKRIYETHAIVQFDPRPPTPLGREVQTVVDMGAGDYWNNREYFETQYRVIASDRVALAVVQQLGLSNDLRFLANAPPDGIVDVGPTTPEKAAQALRARLAVDPIPESRLATVKYFDADPKRAKLVLSALLQEYMDQNLDATLESTKQAVEWLGKQLGKLKGELNESELSLQAYKSNNHILSVSMDDRSNMLREQLRELTVALTQANNKRDEIAAKNSQLARVKPDPRNLPVNALLESALLTSLRQNYENALRRREALLGRGKGENHADVRETAKEVAAAKAAVLAEVANVKGASRAALRAIYVQTGGIAARIARAEKQAQQLSKLQIDYNRLRRARDHNEKLYTYLLERTKETDLQRMLRVNNIRVLDHPKLPEFPVKPRVPLMLLLGAFAGLGFGIAVAVGRNLLDRTIKIPDDIEDELGETCLGVLPNFEAPGSRDPKYGGKKRKRGREPDFKPELIVHTDPTSSVAEAARAIRTNLMFMSPDKPFSTILVTSAAPREGKTTVACSIAAAIAQVGLRVCLVDCDLRRPRIHKVFGMTADVGVTTALLGEVPVQDSIFETDADNLSVMPAGPIPPNPAELFHSEKFRSLLNKLQEDFDRVVIDSSPLLPVTDATVLSTLVDATVLVVRAAVTRREAATRAVRSLADVSSKTVGMVLNAFDFHRHDYKYSHYYGYGRYGYRPHARDQDASDSVRKDDAAQSSGQAARE